MADMAVMILGCCHRDRASAAPLSEPFLYKILYCKPSSLENTRYCQAVCRRCSFKCTKLR